MNFINGQEMNKQNPDTFHIPSQEELDTLKEGVFIKVGHNAERFWAEITSIEDSGSIYARVDNDLLNEHPFKCDDKILVENKHILDIL